MFYYLYNYYYFITASTQLGKQSAGYSICNKQQVIIMGGTRRCQMKTERAGWRADDIASLSSNSFSCYSAQQRVFTATPLTYCH